ncbi:MULTISPECIES: hypothetical protein [unclassified Modestobacter]|uniref:hypothetical protein n=1 Tax=unclassified Modestobacter TaxID=2643866 RepID=UPI0022AAB8DC|nr:MULTISPECIES: hypothetical protein [unclassified Modestobacter]MCZ2811770.1 hypothetical protein [Modestobacter sp. VKM Ac-2979]MCZ2843493.1 hypothetical protein [Modestobacter sp. VKM Ac-2980]MCZ2848549.1 hypothetical protein [Modestobacter sp. VKM Ac-2978]
MASKWRATTSGMRFAAPRMNSATSAMPSSLLRSMATSADWLTLLFRRPFVVASWATVS